MNVEEVFYDYNQIRVAVNELQHKIVESGFTPDLIISIARGGLVTTGILSQNFKVPIVSVNYSSKEGQGNDKHHINDLKHVTQYVRWLYYEQKYKKLNVLIVDDIIDSGATMNDIIIALNMSTRGIKSLKTAVLFYRISAIVKPDYYWTVLHDDRWVMFPWEI
ncbi:MAG: phosphoribosyltransferase [Nitrosopumilaceae archaeon]